MQLLHLCLDEKFIPFARKVYDAAWPGANHFLVYRPDPLAPSHNPPDDRLEHIAPGYFSGAHFRAQLVRADCLVIHCLDADFVPVVATAPASLTVVWHAWGADVYPLLGGRAPALYLPQTRRLLASTGSGRTMRLARDPARLFYLARRKLRYKHHLKACLSRFDVVSMAPAEFDLLTRCRPEVRATFRHFHYNSVEDTFAPGPARMQGPNILLGNSAAAANNHLEAFLLLEGLDLTGRKVICPLSYGDNAYGKSDYAAAIAAEGQRRLGDAFVPLREFLPFQAYGEILAGCGTVMMNHVRQQAVGTIGTALYKGASVYLRPENLVFSYFCDIGCSLFELSSDSSLDLQLNEPEWRANRVALQEWYSFERVVDCARGYGRQRD